MRARVYTIGPSRAAVQNKGAWKKIAVQVTNRLDSSQANLQFMQSSQLDSRIDSSWPLGSTRTRRAEYLEQSTRFFEHSPTPNSNFQSKTLGRRPFYFAMREKKGRSCADASKAEHSVARVPRVRSVLSKNGRVP